MPASATTSRAEDLVGNLNSDGFGPSCIKSLRDIKNQIIGNRTKKLAFIKLGAVPRVASLLAAALSAGPAAGPDSTALVLQSAATLGSFACGVDAGVKAVLHCGAFPHLVAILSSPHHKVSFSLSLPLFFLFPFLQASLELLVGLDRAGYVLMAHLPSIYYLYCIVVSRRLSFMIRLFFS